MVEPDEYGGPDTDGRDDLPEAWDAAGWDDDADADEWRR